MIVAVAVSKRTWQFSLRSQWMSLLSVLAADGALGLQNSPIFFTLPPAVSLDLVETLLIGLIDV